jgi:hypothetical protein
MKVSEGLNSAPKSGMRPLKTLAQFNGEFSAKVRKDLCLIAGFSCTRKRWKFQQWN